MLFFVNALLFAPAFVVLVPLALRSMVRLITGTIRPSVLDTFPALAGYLVPWVGWLAVVPAVLVLRNLRMELPGPARWTLRFFLVVHVGFLVAAAWAWVGRGVA